MQDDAALMERVRHRDAKAFEILYDRYHRLVYGIAVRMLSDGGTAEDATQGVFLKVWSSPVAFHGGNLAAWLGRVTRNSCLDLLRARSRRESATFADVSFEEAAEDRALSGLDAQAVYSALARLPAEQRDPIELAFFGGLTQQRIAEQTQLPLGTVKTRIRSGLQKLRAALESA